METSWGRAYLGIPGSRLRCTSANTIQHHNTYCERPTLPRFHGVRLTKQYADPEAVATFGPPRDCLRRDGGICPGHILADRVMIPQMISIEREGTNAQASTKRNHGIITLSE